MAEAPGAAAGGSVWVGAYLLEVAGSGSFAHFEPEQERQNARDLRGALDEAADEPPAPVAAIEEFQESAEAVTSRIEEADRLLRTAASGGLLQVGNLSGEIDSLLDLFTRLDKAGRFEEELKLMRSLNGLLALTLRWLDLIRSLLALLRSARASGHAAGQAFAHHELGSLKLCAGRPEEAARDLDEALRFEQLAGDVAGRCATSHNLDSARRDAVRRGGFGRPRPIQRLVILAGVIAIAAGSGAGIALAIHGRNGHRTTTTPPALRRTVTVKIVGRGSVSGTGVSCPGRCTISVVDGRTVTLRAVDSATSRFTRWDGVHCSGRECVVTVRSDLEATAVFKAGPHVDKVPPTAPTDLRATTVGASEIDLSWTAAHDKVGVIGYVIYRDGKRLPPLRGATTNFRDPGLKPATVYGYEVRAIDEAGNLSLPSNKVFRKTGAVAGVDVTAPSKPENLTADAVSTSEIVVTWSASTDNVGVASYIVYRDDSAVATVAGDETSFRNSDLDSGSEHVYYVVAVDAAGNLSDPSDRTKAITFSG